jgi:hypothetical protein
MRTLAVPRSSASNQKGGLDNRESRALAAYHSSVDYEYVVRHTGVVVDRRNAMREAQEGCEGTIEV